MKDFVHVLSKLKNLILLETYAAGEKKIKRATSKDIYTNILKKNKKVIYLKNIKDLSRHLKQHIIKEKIIIFMGAGSISNIAKKYFLKNEK